MKKELIMTGKTVEDARRKAAEELQLPEEALTVTVLEEGKRGFLGIGASDAKISVSYTVRGEEAAVNFIHQIIADMGLEGLVIEAKQGNNENIVISVDGDNAGLLIGHHGETMDALQYLTNLAVNKRENGEKRDFVRVVLDIGGYRAKREEALRAYARRMATKVLKYKKSVVLEPMNPYERRIIHSEIQEVEGVSTNSIGAESNRRVVIFLDDGTEGGAQPAEEEN